MVMGRTPHYKGQRLGVILSSMKKKNCLVERIKIGLGIVLLAALTGCVGYVDGGYDGVGGGAGA